MGLLAGAAGRPRPLPGAACDECESLRQSLAAERTATDALRGSLAKERSEAEGRLLFGTIPPLASGV